MKKKFFSFIVVCAFIVTGAMFLTACGEKKCYFTVDAPDHFNVLFSEQNTDSDGKTYVLKGDETEISVSAETGYEFNESPTISFNGAAVDWASFESGVYKYTFTPTADFTIVIGGTVSQVQHTLQFEINEYNNANDFSGSYIKFPNENEQTLSSFLSASDNGKTLTYGENLEFWVYTNEYVDPVIEVASNSYENFVNKSFYNENGKFGYHYNVYVNGDGVLTFSTRTIYSQTSFKTGTNSSYQGPGINNDGTKTINDTDVYIIASIDTAKQELVITLKSDIPEDVLSALTLKINDELQTVTFSAGENKITLNKPYEYNEASDPYDYIIDINYYEIPYFSADTSLAENG